MLVKTNKYFIRILENYNLGIVLKELIFYRLHDSQISKIYTQKDRDDLNPQVLHIKNYLNKKPLLMKKFSNELNAFISKDYLNLAKINIVKGNKPKIIENIKKSRQYYRFDKLSKNWLIQNSDKNIAYLIAKFLLILKSMF
jgi:hypothetical protein